MHRIRVHEELSVSGRAESVREALEQRVPATSERLEFATYLHSLQASLVTLLSAGDAVHSNPYFDDAEAVARARSVRSRLVETMLAEAERLSDATMAQAAAGWNLLMLVWCVTAQLSVALDRIGGLRASDAVEDSVHSRSLARQELLRWPGGIGAVRSYSMLELVAAVDVFRDRLNMMSTFDTAAMRYMLLLELRAAEFVTATAEPSSDYNARVWLRGGNQRQVTLGFVAACAWWFVWLKRYAITYAKLSLPRYFASELAHGCVRSIDASIDLVGRASVVAFVRRYAESLNTDDHEKEFLKIARQYTVAPGDLDEHSYVHGMNGVERASVQDVVGRKRTPQGTTYVGIYQFGRPLVNWVRSLVRRNALNGRGSFTGGGASCEAFYEQLAVLHCVNALFVARLQVNFIEWFVITMRGAGASFERQLHRALALGQPFLVQRSGRWACVVPQPSDARGSSSDLIEAVLGLDYGDTRSLDAAATLYDGADVFDALTVWLRFMLDAWRGYVAQSSRRRLAPLIERIFAERPSDELLRSEASRARTELSAEASSRQQAQRQRGAC